VLQLLFPRVVAATSESHRSLKLVFGCMLQCIIISSTVTEVFWLAVVINYYYDTVYHVDNGIFLNDYMQHNVRGLTS